MAVTEPRRKLQVTYLALALLVGLAVNLWMARSQSVPIDYSDFKALVRSGHVHEVQIGPASIAGNVDLADARAALPEATRQRLPQEGTGGELHFSTLRVEDPALIADLDSAHVRYAAVAGTNWLMQLLSWVAPALIFVAIWTFALGRMGNKQMGDLVGIGKSKARVSVQKNIGVTFADADLHLRA